MRFFTLSILVSFLFACNEPQQVTQDKEEVEEQEPITNPTNKVVMYAEVEWTPLNAARGDQSPQAGTLWGDRGEEVPTGFLVKFKEGFSSPPHIHNVTYKGVVVKGLVHNDDPEAAKMWMSAGSYWTQPAGESHITAAKATENMAFIEIQNGPYLVRPVDQAFDNGERPINLDKSNIVWVDMPGQSTSPKSPKVAYLWGSPHGNELNATFLKLPAGFSGKLMSQGKSFRSVVIEGQLQYTLPGEATAKALDSGSYFSSEGKSIHDISTKEEAVLYVRTNGKYDFIKN